MANSSPILSDPRWQEVLEDRTHGASVLIDWTLSLLRSCPPVENPGELLSEMERQLRIHHPSIPALINLISLLGEELGSSTEVALSAKRIEERRALHKQAIISEAARLIVDFPNVLTISYSGLVRDSLIKAQELGARPRLYIGEGRPRQEGTILATELAHKGISCYLFADLAFAGFLSEIQLTLVGADAVFEESFINKVGTAVLLQMSKLAGIKTALIYDFTKIVPASLKPTAFQSYSEEELFVGVKPESLIILNRYFEEVSLSLIDIEIGRGFGEEF